MKLSLDSVSITEYHNTQPELASLCHIFKGYFHAPAVYYVQATLPRMRGLTT